MFFSLATAAFLALGWATYQFYVTAYGDPTLDHGPFAVEPYITLQERVNAEHKRIFDTALERIRYGLLGMLGGIALMILVFSVALFAPKIDDSAPVPFEVALSMKIDELDKIELLFEKYNRNSNERKELTALYKEKLQEAYEFTIPDSADADEDLGINKTV